jgi:hypothetical protein
MAALLKREGPPPFLEVIIMLLDVAGGFYLSSSIILGNSAIYCPILLSSSPILRGLFVEVIIPG